MRSSDPKPSNVDIVIPTYNRGEVLLNTIGFLTNLKTIAHQIFVVDQTITHSKTIEDQLAEWNQDGVIKWVVLDKPSVVASMNVGLRKATSDFVLFLDDDIKPFDDLLEQYQCLIDQNTVDLAAGRVIQPWDDPAGVSLKPENEFVFNSLDDRQITLFMGGNFLVNRKLALSLGGFDENFKGTAHNFEREFADRVIGSGHTIQYCAKAAIHHLKEEGGGIRSYGHFLKTIKPHHAVGAYYYILRSNLVDRKLVRILKRLYERVATKTHLREPWWIPITLVGDLLGVVWATTMWLSGPKLINQKNIVTPKNIYTQR